MVSGESRPCKANDAIFQFLSVVGLAVKTTHEGKYRDQGLLKYSCEGYECMLFTLSLSGDMYSATASLVGKTQAKGRQEEDLSQLGMSMRAVS